MVNFFKKGLEYRQFQALTSLNRRTKAVKGNANMSRGSCVSMLFFTKAHSRLVLAHRM